MCQEAEMDEQTKPLTETDAEKELTQAEMDKVAGGFNPQPDPPVNHS
jgi:hypothetical protein